MYLIINIFNLLNNKFISNWIGKRLNSKFKYYGYIRITDRFEYLNSNNSIINTFNIGRISDEMTINFNSSRDKTLPLSIHDLITYYDNKFLWNVVKDKLIVEQLYIKNIEKIF